MKNHANDKELKKNKSIILLKLLIMIFQ